MTCTGASPRRVAVARARRGPGLAGARGALLAAALATLALPGPAHGQRQARAPRPAPGWAAFYPDRARDYVLIRVVPERLEVVSPGHGVVGDSLRWRPPSVTVGRR